MRARGVAEVAAALGLAVSKRTPPTFACPACNADRRGRADKRGAAGVRRDGLGWACHRCDAHGDAVTLAALVATGEARPKDWAAVRQACADAGLCDPDPRGPARTPRAPRLPPPPPRVEAPPKRPPAEEVLELWTACRPVTSDPEVCAWLRSRALDPAAVEARDLARALPPGAAVPSWARFCGRAWNAAPQGFRVILPMYGATGALESLRARALTPTGTGDKAAAAAGAELRGLVLADELARAWLAATPLPAGRTWAGELARAGLVLAEGDPDFLTWATHWTDEDDNAPAVLGLVAGSWTADLADRVPNRCRVTLATHPDKQGDAYAAEVAATLAARMRAGLVALNRWFPKEG